MESLSEGPARLLLRTTRIRLATPTPSPQRAYRAACPNCGAPVEFRSAASPFAVCSFCRSTVVRDGDALRKIGESAELFDDHTPLQLGVAGQLPGRAVHARRPPAVPLRRRHLERMARALRQRRRCAEVGLALRGQRPLRRRLRRAADDAAARRPSSCRPGAPLTVDGQSWTVGSVVAAQADRRRGRAAEAAEPRARLRRRRPALEPRRGRHASTTPTRRGRRWSIGSSVVLSGLALTGLREGSEKTLAGRSVQCPSCGAALAGEAGDDAVDRLHAMQVGDRPDVAAAGRHRRRRSRTTRRTTAASRRSRSAASARSRSAAPSRCPGRSSATSSAARSRESDDDEQTFWREYLLYHRSEGFAFLVDAEDGWSWTRADHRRAAERSATASSTKASSTASSTTTSARSPTSSASSTGGSRATSAPPTATTPAPARRRRSG